MKVINNSHVPLGGNRLRRLSRNSSDSGGRSKHQIEGGVDPIDHGKNGLPLRKREFESFGVGFYAAMEGFVAFFGIEVNAGEVFEFLAVADAVDEGGDLVEEDMGGGFEGEEKDDPLVVGGDLGGFGEDGVGGAAGGFGFGAVGGSKAGFLAGEEFHVFDEPTIVAGVFATMLFDEFEEVGGFHSIAVEGKQILESHDPKGHAVGVGGEGGDRSRVGQGLQKRMFSEFRFFAVEIGFQKCHARLSSKRKFGCDIKKKKKRSLKKEAVVEKSEKAINLSKALRTNVNCNENLMKFQISFC